MRSLSGVDTLVVKVGSTSLTNELGTLDPKQLGSLAGQIAAMRKKGAACVFVSSGAIAAGLSLLSLKRRPSDIPTLQAAASVGQGLLVHAYQRAFARRRVPVGQVLLTQDDFIRRKAYVNARNTLQRLLELGTVPIVNENDAVATEEIRFGDNDRLAALVANLVHAKLLIMLSDIDGLYSSDPKRKGAVLLDRVDDVNATDGLRAGRSQSGIGSGGMASKIEAVRIATASGVGVVIANARRPNVIADIVRGKPVGTYFPPRPGKARSKKLWIAFARAPRGTIFVDSGAKEALISGGKSLLAAGVTGSDGAFDMGDAVDVAGPDRTVFGRGLVNYAAKEMPEIQGRRTDGGREVIHRDSLVIL
ncbi:MAG: glutamate 5-kinase [Actinomycetota bacterium]|nr:glutamate 5-kinase [Actinomycetota bacterium]